MNKLYYIYDPMCSWCWGFRQTWRALNQSLSHTTPEIQIQLVLGGLAPDSDEPMDISTQHYIKANWQRIQQQIPHVEFNYAFWEKCQPRRSTYPACRAVIAATQQGIQYEEPMILAIQQAYYLHAKNPSDQETLVDCAASTGLDVGLFTTTLHSESVEQQLQQQLHHYHSLATQTGIRGFPSIILATEEKNIAVPIDYNNPDTSLYFIRDHLCRKAIPQK
jgi:putative protein-disulfide isomerase